MVMEDSLAAAVAGRREASMQIQPNQPRNKVQSARVRSGQYKHDAAMRAPHPTRIASIARAGPTSSAHV